MTLLGHDRYCDEIVGQTELLTGTVRGANLSAPVPSCPDWTLEELLRHIGGAHRWAETLVRTRAQEDIPDSDVPDIRGPEGADPAALTAWLLDGARMTARTLRAAGPDAGVWTWAWERHAGFWARRMALETVVHRADAALAAHVPYEVGPDLAADTVDEWLTIVRHAQEQGDPEAAELRGGGRSLHLHATDAPAGLDAEWLIELGEGGLVWSRAHAKATVALRGPLADVLLVVVRRLPADSDRVQVLGDAKVLDFWLERTSFG